MLLVVLIGGLGRVEEGQEGVVEVKELAEELGLVVLGEAEVVKLASNPGEGVGAAPFEMEEG
jgi:hypothetical protein